MASSSASSWREGHAHMGLHLRVLCEAWIVLAPQPQTMGVI